jgi:hypothetical protein
MNRKSGIYMPLPIPSRPWELVSMDFIGGLPITNKGINYFIVVIDHFNKMAIMIPCKKTVTVQEAT